MVLKPSVVVVVRQLDNTKAIPKTGITTPRLVAATDVAVQRIGKTRDDELIVAAGSRLVHGEHAKKTDWLM